MLRPRSLKASSGNIILVLIQLTYPFCFVVVVVFFLLIISYFVIYDYFYNYRLTYKTLKYNTYRGYYMAARGYEFYLRVLQVSQKNV